MYKIGIFFISLCMDHSNSAAARRKRLGSEKNACRASRICSSENRWRVVLRIMVGRSLILPPFLFTHRITLLSENSKPRFRLVNLYVTRILAIPFYRVDREECERGSVFAGSYRVYGCCRFQRSLLCFLLGFFHSSANSSYSLHWRTNDFIDSPDHTRFVCPY